MNNQRAYFNIATHRYSQHDAVHPPHRQQREMEQLGNFSGKKIVDFGAGSGRVSFWFLKLGCDVTAFDISPKSLEDLSAMYKKNRSSTWGKLSIASSLPANTFDAIVGADILHHVDVAKELPRLRTILKSGGHIAFSEPNGANILWYIFIFLKRLPWSIERGITQTTRKNLHEQLRKAGFKHISIRSHGMFAYRLIISARTW